MNLTYAALISWACLLIGVILLMLAIDLGALFGLLGLVGLLVVDRFAE